MPVLSTDKSEGMLGGRGMGGACGNIKVLSSTLFQHQSCISVEDLQSQHALCMLGRTLHACNMWQLHNIIEKEMAATFWCTKLMLTDPVVIITASGVIINIIV